LRGDLSPTGNKCFHVGALMPKGEIYLDITNLKNARGDRAYLRMFLKRNPEASRRMFLRFDTDGLSSWKALRALANVRLADSHVLRFVESRSVRLVDAYDFHPRVRHLAGKQKLSTPERNRLRSLRNAVKLKIRATREVESPKRTSESDIKRKPDHRLLSSDAPPRQLFLDNVWPPEPERDNAYGNSKFPGNCSATVCKQCLWRYTKVGDIVLDPMTGSGTLIDVAKALGRKCIAFDINPVPYRDDIRAGDARRLSLENESIDFVFIHAPYWNMYQYSDPPMEGDLSAMEFDEFLEGIRDVFKEALRVLRPGRFAAVLVGDMRREMRFYDMPSEFSSIARLVGLELHDKIVKPIARERSRSLRSEIVARRHNFHLLKFETILVFRKPGHGASSVSHARQEAVSRC